VSGFDAVSGGVFCASRTKESNSAIMSGFSYGKIMRE